MKMTTTFLLILLIFAAKSQLSEFGNKKCTDYEEGNEDDNHAFSLDFCRTLSYDTANYKCCYYEYEDSKEVTQYYCKQLTLSEFANIDDFVDSLEKEHEDVKLDCHSSYLYASLLLIFALIF